MYSLHLTGSPWFLLLLPAGAVLLWLVRPRGGAAPRSAAILFSLQAAALALLAVSLAGPELRRQEVRFHDPAVLILRDRSASFRAGAALGLEERYRDFERRLEEAYAARGIAVHRADFAAAAWPRDGSGGSGEKAGDTAAPTSLAAAADFADSAGIPNLQAVFLLSDGRGVLDSGKAARVWRVPLHPVVFAPDSIGEVQLVSVSLDGGELEVEWEAIGPVRGDPDFRILDGRRVLLSRKLPAGPDSGSGGRRVFRIPWTPPAGGGDLRAVLIPAGAGANIDPWNDTVPLPAGPAAARLFALKPVRTLDEKGLFDLLRRETRIDPLFFSAAEAKSLELSPADQIWVEAGALSDSALIRRLREQPARVAVYARCADGPDFRPPRLPGVEGDWTGFTGAAAIRAAGKASEIFPAEIARLRDLTRSGLRAPPVPAAGLFAGIRERGAGGMLAGRIPLGSGKQALFLCLPAVWGDLFDPFADYGVRENISAYVRAARLLARRVEGAARATLPDRVFAEAPFAADIGLPPGAGRAGGDAAAGAGGLAGAGSDAAAAEGKAAFGIAGPAYAAEWFRPAGEEEGWTVKDIALPAGRYRAWIRRGADTLWSDSLEAAPREALELARLGFDEAFLSESAARSGGSILRPAGASVTSVLPAVAEAQTRSVRVSAVRLYNTLPLCLAVVALLALSWVLRKKWNLD